MMRARFIARLLRNERGTVLIETAIVAPLLVLMSLGAFQVSQVVARQTELQEAASEAASIVLASPPEDTTERNTIKDIVVASTGLQASQVILSEQFRCGEATAYVASESSCSGTKVAHYILIELNDTYTPTWTQFGVGSPIVFNVDRYVMVKQS